jgi:hypothetical protein
MRVDRYCHQVKGSKPIETNLEGNTIYPSSGLGEDKNLMSTLLSLYLVDNECIVRVYPLRRLGLHIYIYSLGIIS